MHLLHQLVRNLKTRPKAHLAGVVVVAASQLSFTALAAAPAMSSATPGSGAVTCAAPEGTVGSCAAQTAADGPQLTVPQGAAHCAGSGPGAACGGNDATAGATPGVASLPAGQVACAGSAIASLPPTPVACSNTVLTADSSPSASTARGASSGVLPSVPTASLIPGALGERLALDVDATTVRSGHSAVLTATAAAPVTAGSAIEIFDVTSKTLAGACANAGQCVVGYSARGGVHTFAAYITAPSLQLPARETSIASNSVNVAWLDSTIAANSTVVGPGHGVTLTATSTIDVGRSGRWLEIYDLTAKTRLTYCTRGTTCATSLTQTAGGTHEIVGYVTGQPEAVSTPVYVTWLTVSLAASTTTLNSGGTVYLQAATNADLTTTPWVIGIYDEHGRLVDHACKTGRTCSVQAWVSGATPWYTAVIGALPPASKPTPLTRLLQDITPTGLADVQARSSAVQPTRLLWGVDSCKAFTQDWYGATGLLPQITASYGRPDFWGRYLTNTVCPGISADEVNAAARVHMGILPIYNDYNCSNVSGYSTGHSYADAASQAAERLGIPKGKALAIDIEPSGVDCPGAAYVDSAFIEGWYDGVYSAGYVPAYYGNGTNGSEFASAWCNTVAVLPNVARDSYLWSFEPSLLGSYTKSNAPAYSPFNPGCAGLAAAWQYQIGSSSANPNIDSDEALSQIPIWYPE